VCGGLQEEGSPRPRYDLFRRGTWGRQIVQDGSGGARGGGSRSGQTFGRGVEGTLGSTWWDRAGGVQRVGARFPKERGRWRYGGVGGGGDLRGAHGGRDRLRGGCRGPVVYWLHRRVPTVEESVGFGGWLCGWRRYRPANCSVAWDASGSEWGCCGRLTEGGGLDKILWRECAAGRFGAAVLQPGGAAGSGE